MSTVYGVRHLVGRAAGEVRLLLACVSDDDKKDDKKSGEDEARCRKPARTSADRSAKPVTTPMEFYKKYVPVDVDDLVTLCNVPMASCPFNKRYRIRYTANVAEAGDMEFVNVPLDVFKKAAVDQISAGHPIIRLRLHPVLACGRLFHLRQRARGPAVRHRFRLRQGARPRIRRQPPTMP